MGNFRGGGGGGGGNPNCPPGGGGQPAPQGRGIPGMVQRLQQQRGGAPQVDPIQPGTFQGGPAAGKPNLDPRAFPGQGTPPMATTQPVQGDPRGMNPMMQKQQAMAQRMRGGVRRPPNPGGSRMRGGMRGGGRGMY